MATFSRQSRVLRQDLAYGLPSCKLFQDQFNGDPCPGDGRLSHHPSLGSEMIMVSGIRNLGSVSVYNGAPGATKPVT